MMASQGGGISLGSSTVPSNSNNRSEKNVDDKSNDHQHTYSYDHWWILSFVCTYATKFILEVFGGGGAMWGFSEACGLRTPANSVWFWRPIALSVSFLFGLRWLYQLYYDLETTYTSKNKGYYYQPATSTSSSSSSSPPVTTTNNGSTVSSNGIQLSSLLFFDDDEADENLDSTNIGQDDIMLLESEVTALRNSNAARSPPATKPTTTTTTTKKKKKSKV
jgi:hypothetical protein